MVDYTHFKWGTPLIHIQDLCDNFIMVSAVYYVDNLLFLPILQGLEVEGIPIYNISHEQSCDKSHLVSERQAKICSHQVGKTHFGQYVPDCMGYCEMRTAVW